MGASRAARMPGWAALGLCLVVALSACSYVDRIAIRINADDSVDILSCERLDEVEGVRVYVGDDDARSFDADELVMSGTGLDAGDTLRIPDAIADDDWERLYVDIHGTLGSRDGWSLDGVFQRDQVEAGEWAWARSGIMIGTVPVEGCDADEASSSGSR